MKPKKNVYNIPTPNDRFLVIGEDFIAFICYNTLNRFGSKSEAVEFATRKVNQARAPWSQAIVFDIWEEKVIFRCEATNEHLK